MKGKQAICTMGAFALLCIGKTAAADVLYMENGDRLSGEIIEMKEQVLQFASPYAGSIAVPWEQVAGIESDRPITVLLEDETTLRGMAAHAGEGEVKMQLGRIVQTVSFPMAEIRAINPAVAKELRVTGNLNVGVSVTQGNSDTKDFHVDGELVARTRKSRYTIRGEYNQAEDDGEKTVDNALVSLKYDWFFKEKWFLFNSASFETDEFQDLELRSTLAAGLGHQFLETTRTNLSLESGLSYLNEDYEAAEDDSSMAARWSLNFDHFIWPATLQLFHFQEGFMSLENTQDIFIRSRTGLRLPLNDNLSTTAQYHLDWDNDPAPGRDSVDEKYLLTVGYNW